MTTKDWVLLTQLDSSLGLR